MQQKISKRFRIGGASLAMLCAFTYFTVKLTDTTSDIPSRFRQQTHAEHLTDPMLQYSLLAKSEEPYTSNGRNIFSTVEDPVAPVKGNHYPQPTPFPTASQPSAPQNQTRSNNLLFYGFAKRPDSAKRVFLLDGDDIFIGSEGDVIDRHYKILHVNEHSIEVEDLLDEQRQTLLLQEHS